MLVQLSKQAPVKLAGFLVEAEGGSSILRPVTCSWMQIPRSFNQRQLGHAERSTQTKPYPSDAEREISCHNVCFPKKLLAAALRRL